MARAVRQPSARVLGVACVACVARLRPFMREEEIRAVLKEVEVVIFFGSKRFVTTANGHTEGHQRVLNLTSWAL